ncbi:hypothetical protein [Solidesulfovibrio magneticus]|uniref:hypothetical protein n=1 Tax=Solidesulfovibrio magneticus TaxID=184917 RepID=UPI0005BB54D2|nr:hypothetical protein [Solidesulfovibrio magneticus]
MKCTALVATVLSLLLSSSFALAEGKIPSLVGKWDVETKGGVMLNSDKESSITHWTPGQKILNGQLEIISQDDRFVKGTYTSQRGSEKIIGMISSDGKFMYSVDADGFVDWRIVGKDKLEGVYRHAKPSDSVVAIGIAKRQK